VLTQNSSSEVDGTARRKRHNDSDGAVRIFLIGNSDAPRHRQRERGKKDM